MGKDYWDRVGSRPIRHAHADIINYRYKVQRKVVQRNRWAAEPAPRGPFEWRPLYEFLAPTITPQLRQQAELNYRQWFRETLCSFAAAVYALELADSHRKAYTRNTQRMSVSLVRDI